MDKLIKLLFNVGFENTVDYTYTLYRLNINNHIYEIFIYHKSDPYSYKVNLQFIRIIEGFYVTYFARNYYDNEIEIYECIKDINNKLLHIIRNKKIDTILSLKNGEIN